MKDTVITLASATTNQGPIKHGDIVFGVIGTVTTSLLSFYNGLVCAAAGTLTLGIMILRFRREWRNRNKPPEE